MVSQALKTCTGTGTHLQAPLQIPGHRQAVVSWALLVKGETLGQAGTTLHPPLGVCVGNLVAG